MARKPAEDTPERRPLPRLYAHYHRLLISLLEDLVRTGRVVWLGEGRGHIRRPDGEPNTYNKALYLVETLEPYASQLDALAEVQSEGHTSTGRKPVGLLVPTTHTDVRHVVLSRSTSWGSHTYPKEVLVAKLEGAVRTAQHSLRAFATFARTFDPRREALEAELTELERNLSALRACREPVLRERARTVKHMARLLKSSGEGRDETSITVYVRDVGLIVAGPGLTAREGAVEFATTRKRRADRLEGRLEPVARFGNFEVYSEQLWQETKGQVAS